MAQKKRKQVRGSYDRDGVWVSAAEKRDYQEQYKVSWRPYQFGR